MAMITMKKRFFFPLFLLILSLLPVKAYPFSDQTTTERIIRENKEFVEFLNISLSNFSRDKKDDFLKCYEKHFNGEIAFLQSDYRRAYKRVYSSQEDMVKLYEHSLRDRYLANSKDLLDKLAPSIIRSKNARARLYLTLGYRDRTVSWTHYTVGEASNPKLFSYKIFKYEEGIKMARRSKRYGFLALFESQKDETKRRIYNLMMKKEKETGNVFFNRFIDLPEDQYIREMNKSIEELEKADQTKEKSTEAKASDEKKLERRVRYRKEKRTAEFLIEHDFDQAEDIMRTYITDFNYKLIDATLVTLGSMKGEVEGPEGAINFEELRLHLLDNYGRLSGESLIKEISGMVKVEDALEKLPDEVEEQDKKPESVKTPEKGSEPAPLPDKDKGSEPSVSPVAPPSPSTTPAAENHDKDPAPLK